MSTRARNSRGSRGSFPSPTSPSSRRTSCWFVAILATCSRLSGWRGPPTERWFRTYGGQPATMSSPSPLPPVQPRHPAFPGGWRDLDVALHGDRRRGRRSTARALRERLFTIPRPSSDDPSVILRPSIHQTLRASVNRSAGGRISHSSDKTTRCRKCGNLHRSTSLTP